MLNYLNYRSKLRKFSNKKRKIQNVFSKEIGGAYQQKKSHDKIESIKRDECFEVEMIQEEIDILITNYLRNKASTLLVPLPEYENKKMWTECNKISQQKVLTTLGINTTKTAIRKEWNEKLEPFWKLSAFLIGIIGAMSALITALILLKD